MEIRSGDEWVLYRLEKFYAVADNLERVRKIINGESGLSLRLIDWFVTNYSKKYNVSYVTDSGKHVVVYLDYKNRLRAYSKQRFDPFCRSKHIKFHGMDTTVGQLSFFEWALPEGVLAYLEAHKDEIHADMETRVHKPKDDESPRKRHELSRSATNTLKRHDVKVVVRFD
jgi:hypothetical protein